MVSLSEGGDFVAGRPPDLPNSNKKTIMRAVVAASKLCKVLERPIPSLTAGQVLIKVHAAGINRPDIMQRMGLYPPPLGASDVLGLEISGEIVATSSNTDDIGDRIQLGDRVCALVTGGAYAEYCVA